MAYDKAKAHEYYEKYKKKGLKKGRKKGKKKASAPKVKSQSLAGTSTAGLNSDGAIEATIIKDRLKKEMNEALQSAKTDAEREEIRREFSKKANAEIEKLKSDPKFAKPKAEKKAKSITKGSVKTSSSPKISKASRNSPGSSQNSREEMNKAIAHPAAQQASQAKTEAPKAEESKSNTARVLNIVSSLREKWDMLSDEQKDLVTELMSSLIDKYKKLMLEEDEEKAGQL